ncbi:MAG: hypothetical protein LBS70_05580 [Candidatus Accumulibacter sp.]|jgi:hypothetical protein|nr:hypothetical protein [Accumulibacter sp.]
MKQAVLIGAASAVLLAGCATHYADAPTPIRFEPSYQYKLTAADHWRRIADDFAGKLAEAVKQKGAGAAVYVAINERGETPFVEGFRELLTTALTRQGWDVRTKSGDGVLNASVRYSVYKFQPDRQHSGYYDGHYNDARRGDSPYYYDDFIVDGPTPQTEILVTAAITKGDQVVTRYSEIYYAADEDSALYWKKYGGRRGTPTLIPVKGGE